VLADAGQDVSTVVFGLFTADEFADDLIVQARRRYSRLRLVDIDRIYGVV
jgi:hypothetical protein